MTEKLKILKEVKILFDFFSDGSDLSIGYIHLCNQIKKLEKLESKQSPNIDISEPMKEGKSAEDHLERYDHLGCEFMLDDATFYSTESVIKILQEYRNQGIVLPDRDNLINSMMGKVEIIDFILSEIKRLNKIK